MRGRVIKCYINALFSKTSLCETFIRKLELRIILMHRLDGANHL